jgi:hypothetical protein
MLKNFVTKKIIAIRDKILNPITNQITLIIEQVKRVEENQRRIELRLKLLQNALGRVELRQLENQRDESLDFHEYQVYSQWGEDGIIQFLIKNILIKKRIFVEFGVETYEQSNTRFLLVNDNWSGLIIDGSQENILKIKNDEVYWNYNLKAICSFVSKENINELLIKNGLSGEIGLLSIDIDGNDYWIWDAINVINPEIVIVEYNYRFGDSAAVTIPYQDDFVREKAHYSMIYFGASLKALCLLAKRKGYFFVGCSSNGVNAFFVREDKSNSILREITAEQGYKVGQFCETRNKEGIQVKMSPEEEVKLLQSLKLPLVDIDV